MSIIGSLRGPSARALPARQDRGGHPIYDRKDRLDISNLHWGLDAQLGTIPPLLVAPGARGTNKASWIRAKADEMLH